MEGIMESVNSAKTIHALQVESKENKTSIPVDEVELHHEEKNSTLGKKAVSSITCLLTLGLSKASSLAGRKIIINLLNTSAYSKKECQALVTNFTTIHPNSSERVHVAIKDTDVVLDGMAIRGHPEKDPKDQIWVIRLHGMSGRYEPALNDAKTQAEEMGVNVLLFNYRGTGESKGDPAKPQNYVDDSLAMIEHLKKKGVPAENIVLQGHSFGGGVAARAVTQKGNSSIRLISQQSFASFDKATKAYVNKMTGGILGGVAAAAVKSLGFSFNAVKLYQNDEHLAGRTFIFHSGAEDQMVAEKASLATGLRKKNIAGIGDIQEIKKENVVDSQKERYTKFIEDNYKDRKGRKDFLINKLNDNDTDGIKEVSKAIYGELFHPAIQDLKPEYTQSYTNLFRDNPPLLAFQTIKKVISTNDKDHKYEDLIAKLTDLRNILKVEEDPHLQPLSHFDGANKAMASWLEKKPANEVKKESGSKSEISDIELIRSQRTSCALSLPL